MRVGSEVPTGRNTLYRESNLLGSPQKVIPLSLAICRTGTRDSIIRVSERALFPSPRKRSSPAAEREHPDYHVPRAETSQLPALLQWTARFTNRHLDAKHRGSVARLSA